MTAWSFLGIAIVLEVAGTFLLKLSDGFAKWHWGVLSIICFMCCFWAFAPAIKIIPVGIAYAIWAGIGILAASAIGFLVFGERLGAFQVACIAFILAGSVGLRLTTTA
ncbi:MAG: multidrug efflux SMR transporter [Paracoccaceae bacterium]|nr:multidrug efflux SMR transporter [Paracoccaceae bacterium]MDE2913899.1 multidrug efflux SMR transporter [Paracoccaceae bacterium]